MPGLIYKVIYWNNEFAFVFFTFVIYFPVSYISRKIYGVKSEKLILTTFQYKFNMLFHSKTFRSFQRINASFVLLIIRYQVFVPFVFSFFCSEIRLLKMDI